jgi:hypothetical protein
MQKAIIGSVVVLMCAAGLAAQTTVQMKDLPAAVRRTVLAETKDAKIVNMVKETANGQPQFEIETLVNGKTRDLIILTNGHLETVKLELASADVPPAAMKAFSAGGGKVGKVESVKSGKPTYYEAIVEKDGKKTEVTVDANGKPVKP